MLFGLYLVFLQNFPIFFIHLPTQAHMYKHNVIRDKVDEVPNFNFKYYKLPILPKTKVLILK